jgi:hypothetical protein
VPFIDAEGEGGDQMVGGGGRPEAVECHDGGGGGRFGRGSAGE